MTHPEARAASAAPWAMTLVTISTAMIAMIAAAPRTPRRGFTGEISCLTRSGPAASIMREGPDWSLAARWALLASPMASKAEARARVPARRWAALSAETSR